jgi:integrase
LARLSVNHALARREYRGFAGTLWGAKTQVPRSQPSSFACWNRINAPHTFGNRRARGVVERDLVLPSAAEVLALAGGLTEKYRLPFILLEQTAMRVGEVVSLERDDVDVAGLRFRIKAVNRKGRRGSRRARFVPVPGWLMEIVATSLPLGGRLFPNVTANGLRSAMSDLCENTGLTHCTPHRLRHRRISFWHFQGVPARELADRAGHSKPSP